MNIKHLIKISIKSITVEWSESNTLESLESKPVSLDVFNSLVDVVASKFDEDDLSYKKTKVAVTFVDGTVGVYRLDVNYKARSIVDVVEHYVF